MTIPERILALPYWQGDLAAEPLSGGLSNEIWKVTDAAGAHVVRLGEDYPFHHVDRAREAMTALAAHEAGFGPAVQHVDPGVMVTEFVEARTWGEADLRNNPEQVGHLLAQFHTRMAAHVTGAAFLFWPFHVIRDYAHTLTGTRHAEDLPKFLALSAEMEAAQVPLPIIFGHHDLLPANFLDDGARLWLIDYEYAGFGTALFDLAGAASNAGMSAEQADALLAAYFGAKPDTSLMRAFDAMQVASLLRETLWAMVSGIHLAAPGVDYDAYAVENRDRMQVAIETYQTRWGSTP
ncbi:choline/ethanolamine kinase family protein [Sedimentitalea sp.]|uniref:choline/ethanolamine kinase family protein n=1 Tax=Sedimentitalea sp. TaxID=2048915 RepID=UPI003298CE01